MEIRMIVRMRWPEEKVPSFWDWLFALQPVMVSRTFTKSFTKEFSVKPTLKDSINVTPGDEEASMLPIHSVGDVGNDVYEVTVTNYLNRYGYRIDTDREASLALCAKLEAAGYEVRQS